MRLRGLLPSKGRMYASSMPSSARHILCTRNIVNLTLRFAGLLSRIRTLHGFDCPLSTHNNTKRVWLPQPAKPTVADGSPYKSEVCPVLLTASLKQILARILFVRSCGPLDLLPKNPKRSSLSCLLYTSDAA